MPLRSRDFIQDVRVAVKHAGVVHHLPQADHPGVGEKFLQVGCDQAGTRGFHVGCGNAGGKGVKHVDGLALGRFQHVADSRLAEHVGDLVRVGHHGGGAVDHDGARKLGHTGHGTFDVDMGVDEARGDEAPAQVDHPARGVIAEACDTAAGHGHPAGVNLARKDVDDPAVGQEQVAGPQAPRRLDQLIEWHGD